MSSYRIKFYQPGLYRPIAGERSGRNYTYNLMAVNIASQAPSRLLNPLRDVFWFIFSDLWFASLTNGEIVQSCGWFEGPTTGVAVDGIIQSVPAATALDGIIIPAFPMAHINTSSCGVAAATAVAPTEARPDNNEIASFTS